MENDQKRILFTVGLIAALGVIGTISMGAKSCDNHIEQCYDICETVEDDQLKIQCMTECKE
jgi:hypothetical protein